MFHRPANLVKVRQICQKKTDESYKTVLKARRAIRMSDPSGSHCNPYCRHQTWNQNITTDAVFIPANNMYLWLTQITHLQERRLANTTTKNLLLLTCQQLYSTAEKLHSKCMRTTPQRCSVVHAQNKHS